LKRPISSFIDELNEDTTILDFADIYCPEFNPDIIRLLLELYKRLHDLQDLQANIAAYADTLDTGNILLADECDFLNGLKCVATVVDLEERSLQESTRCDINCEGCPGKIEELKCVINGIEGLSFPFLDEPTNLLYMLRGVDTDIVRFEPPEATFVFSYPLQFTLWYPPTIALRLLFDFTCRFKYGIVLTTKGIQEAIEQRTPIKALNSFALVDRFDGVDSPIVLITSSMAVQVVTESYFVTASVAGGLEMNSLIDLYDPYPSTSGGLVRPYELLTMSLDPTDWIEFQVEISWFIEIYLNLADVYSYETRVDDLILRIMNDPVLEETILSCDPETRTMQLLPPYDSSFSSTHGDQTLACTGLEGQNGDETIECALEKPWTTEEVPFQRCDRISHIGTQDSIHLNQHFNVMLRDIQSPTDLSSFGILEILELDYRNRGHLIIVGNSIVLGGSSVNLGEASLTFDSSLEKGIFYMPVPEQQQLFTTISSECNSA